MACTWLNSRHLKITHVTVNIGFLEKFPIGYGQLSIFLKFLNWFVTYPSESQGMLTETYRKFGNLLYDQFIHLFFISFISETIVYIGSGKGTSTNRRMLTGGVNWDGRVRPSDLQSGMAWYRPAEHCAFEETSNFDIIKLGFSSSANRTRGTSEISTLVKTRFTDSNIKQ